MFAVSEDCVNTKQTGAEDKKGIWATMRDIPHGIETAGTSPQEALESQPPNLTACVCNWWKVYKSGDGS